MSLLRQEVSADSVRAVIRRVFADPEYEWDIRRNPFQFFSDWFNAAVRWFAELEASHPVTYWILIGVLTGTLLALVVHFAYLVSRALKPGAVTLARASLKQVRPHDFDWHLSEAKRLAAEERYGEALAHRFVAMALELDRRKVIRFHPSKTPAEYIEEAKLGREELGELGTLIGTLYQHVFGGSACSAEDLVSFDRRATALVAGNAKS